MASITQSETVAEAAPLSIKLAAPAIRIPQPAGDNKLFRQAGVTHGDWRDDLIRDGYVVVKGAVPKERALQYGDDMMTYLETL